MAASQKPPSSPPQRIQRRRSAGWRMPEGAVYVGRPSRWGNPFRIYRKRHLIGPPWIVARETWKHLPAEECLSGYTSSSQEIEQAEAVRVYATLLRVRERDEPERLAAWLAPLRGRDLACWCRLDQPCHADALLAALTTTDEETTRG